MKKYSIISHKNSYFTRTRMRKDEFWSGCEVLTDFSYPWHGEPAPSMVFRALHDKRYLFFRFDVIDSEIHIEKSSTDKMAVLESDRVELFFRRDSDMKPYFGLEMDPSGRLLDYKAGFYREFDYSWRWKGIEIQSEYTVNGYCVRGRITLDSLKALELLKKGKIETGIFRGKCLLNESNNKEFKWISWVRPESEKPDFHIPSAFGEIILL
ncbi:MAG: endoxylanase [Bacteroidales bacterium]|nr:endoxylanase [Bacteroidales bacterium]